MFQLTPPAYHSPDDTHPSLLQRLIPWCTRLPFYARTIRSLLKGRRQSLRGEFCDQVFSDRAVDILRAVEKAGGKVHITGMEHIAGTPGPAVFAGNHMSMLEIFLLPAAISPHKGVGFVVKESLGRNWLMGPVVDAQQAIQVGRTNAREDLATVLREGQERLGRNHSMIIFPQGTRSDSFPVSRFNSLGVKLAKRAGVPLIPFAAKTDFLANGRWVKDLGPVHPERDVHIAFGPAITDVSDQKTAQQTCIDFIRTKLTEWGATCVE